MPISAIIFDVDGTLIDSNGAHVEAWQRAFARHGYEVTQERITVEIGKGGDKLVPSILGEPAEAKDGDSLREAQTGEFIRLLRAGPIEFRQGDHSVAADPADIASTHRYWRYMSLTWFSAIVRRRSACLKTSISI